MARSICSHLVQTPPPGADTGLLSLLYNRLSASLVSDIGHGTNNPFVTLLQFIDTDQDAEDIQEAIARQTAKCAEHDFLAKQCVVCAQELVLCVQRDGSATSHRTSACGC